jgi:hypothetical protein
LFSKVNTNSSEDECKPLDVEVVGKKKIKLRIKPTVPKKPVSFEAFRDLLLTSKNSDAKKVTFVQTNLQAIL